MTIWGHSTAAGLPCIFKSPGGAAPPGPQLGPLSNLTASWPTRKVRKGEGWGQLKQAQVRWLDLPSSGTWTRCVWGRALVWRESTCMCIYTHAQLGSL